ncbi:MAG: hypothetical protein J0M24_09035 [Verrucomicrobia bacterium]|nr:hypothetical protein [Verrucomicrobiota bacterium]
MLLNLPRINAAVNDRVVVSNYVVINDLAIVVDMAGLVAHNPKIGAILNGEIACWRPAIVCSAISEAETHPNAATGPS